MKGEKVVQMGGSKENKKKKKKKDVRFRSVFMSVAP